VASSEEEEVDESMCMTAASWEVFREDTPALGPGSAGVAMIVGGGVAIGGSCEEVL